MVSKYTARLGRHGVMFADPRPTSAEMTKFYAEEYYQTQQGSYRHQYTTDELEYFTNEAVLSEHVASKTFSAIKQLYDIGCGEGFFANYFYKKKWDIKLNDISDWGIREFNPHLSKYLHKGEFLDVVKFFEKRDCLINLSNVLEHVINPGELLETLRDELMTHDSLIRISVPNDYSKFQNFLINSEMAENTWFCPPQHLNYFNSDNISHFLKDYNFEIVKMIGTFPVEVFLANKHSNYHEDKSKGKGAHEARVRMFNYLFSNFRLDECIDYLESSTKVSLARDLVIFAKKRKL